MVNVKRLPRRRGSPTLAAAVSAALTMAGTASAQSSGGLEEIIVTATRRAESLRRVRVDQRIRYQGYRDARAQQRR
jgi:hypothetical protein